MGLLASVSVKDPDRASIGGTSLWCLGIAVQVAVNYLCLLAAETATVGSA